MRFCASFLIFVFRFAISCNLEWRRYKISACTAGAALAWLLLADGAGAADDIWKAAPTANWSNTANWSTGAVPGINDVVRYDNLSTTNLNTNQDIPNLSVAGIVNTSAVSGSGVAGPVSITGNPITVGATGLIMVSGNPQGPSPYTLPAQADLTVDVDLTLSADQRWKAGGPGTATTAQPGGNQALIVGATANGHTVTLNGFRPTLSVISNQFDQIIVNSKLVDGSTASSVGISKATGTTTSLNYDTGNINSTTRVRFSGDNTYSGGTEIIGGRQIIQLNSNSVAGVSGPLGTGPITIHTDAPLAGGLPNNQTPYFSPFGADRTLYNDIILNNVIANTPAAQSYPAMYNAGSAGDTTHALTLNGAISIQTNATVVQNSATSNQTAAPGDFVFNGTVLLGGADFNDDGVVDAGDYVSWRKNSAAHGGADGYRIWRETFGTSIPTLSGPITTGTFSVGQTASPSMVSGKSIFNGNILQTNNAAYTLNVQNGSGAMPSIVRLSGQNTFSAMTDGAGAPTNTSGDANIQIGSNSTMSGPTIVSGPLGTGTVTVTVGSAIQAFGAARTVANPFNLSTLQSTVSVLGTNDLTLNGAISGFGGVTNYGTGKLVFGATNSYAGATTVHAGTLLVNGSVTSTSGVTVDSGATLGGTGSITTVSPIANSGTIAPGASVGSLNVTGDVNDQAGSSWAIELSGTSSDLLAVTGNITLGSDSLNVSGVGSGASWIIASYTGTLTGTFGSVTSGYSVDYGTGTNSVITLHTPGSGAGGGLSNAAVPEPGTVCLGMFAVGLATAFRRRNRGKR